MKLEKKSFYDLSRLNECKPLMLSAGAVAARAEAATCWKSKASGGFTKHLGWFLVKKTWSSKGLYELQASVGVCDFVHVIFDGNKETGICS